MTSGREGRYGAGRTAARRREKKEGIVLTERPLNVETPDLRPFITSSRSFYIRNHFPIPVVKRSSWRLAVGGEVDAPMTFNYTELARMPSVTRTATLECAGNGRTGFAVPAPGETRWGKGAVGTAKWTGVRLREVLDKCRPRSGAREVVFEGLDSGTVPGQGAITYARSLPWEKAMSEETLIALRMNGGLLPRAHGYPARLVVPGWYGMASVKWLSTITVRCEGGYRAYFNGTKYVYLEERADEPSVQPVREVRVKSLITRPTEGETLLRGERVIVTGKAWSGSGRIARVQVDTGSGWEEAELERLGAGKRFAWVDWKMDWVPAKGGDTVLSSRAIDEAGNTQPMTPYENKYQYGYNAVDRVRVEVK